MSLFTSTTELAQQLRTTPEAIEFSTTDVNPISNEAKRERFAISGYILSEVIDIAVQRDPNPGGEGITFSSELDKDVSDIGSLAIWTMNLFSSVVEQRYKVDATFRRSVDRLASLNQASNTIANEVSGVNVSKQQDSITLTMSGMQVDNFARDLDGMNRRLHFAAGFYGLKAPDASNTKEHLRLALADGMEMSRQSIVVQDFFDALEDLSLFIDGKTEYDSSAKFNEAVNFTNMYWARTHGHSLKNGYGTVVPGKKPKAFYKIQENRGLLRVAPMIENIRKLTDTDVEDERIGCAGSLLKSEKLGHSPLQLGMRATLQALEEIGYYEAPAETFKGISPLKTEPFMYSGTQYFLGSGFMSTLHVLKM